jgi:hypothetical protein
MLWVRREAKLMRQTSWIGDSPPWARASFAAYLSWNIIWLASGRIPPSAIRALLGVPCPTTGCTRALLSLLRGHLQGSLLWNPFLVPILILLGLSLQMLTLAALRKNELVLPKWMGGAWWSVLVMAWIAKFVLGRAYW